MNAVALPAPFATPKTPYPSAVKTPALSGAAVNLTMIPGAECEKKDSKALETLSPANRDAWFAEHTLPEHIRYYSVVSFPDPDNISNGLQRFHRQLGELKDARNDSQVVFYDQVIPGSTILGFFNADHWAMSVPIARQHEVSQAIFADKNEFPREIALEAILRFIEEDLESGAAHSLAPEASKQPAAAQLSPAPPRFWVG